MTSAPAPAAAPAASGEPSFDAAGLLVVFHADGRVSLSGPDPFGGRVDSSFETVGFLIAALPVLERSISADQASALATELAPYASDGGAATAR